MAEFVTVAQTSDLTPNSLKSVQAGGQDIALVNANGQLYAIGDTCTHAHCSLADGDVDGERVICPCHGSEFNIMTGEVVEGPATEGVPTFQVRVQGNDIQVAV